MSVQALRVHVSLNVSNVAQSVEFYRRMFATEPVRVRPGYAKFDVVNPPINLALNERPAAARTSHDDGALSHLGLQVGSTADVLEIRQNWIDAGLITRDEMNTDCCYASQDKTWAHDPDGNEWEVFVVLGESDKMASMESTCCTPAEKQKTAAAAEAAEASSCCVDAEGGDPAVTGKDCACACAS